MPSEQESGSSGYATASGSVCLDCVGAIAVAVGEKRWRCSDITNDAFAFSLEATGELNPHTTTCLSMVEGN